MTKLTYPEVRRDGDVVDDFHGNKVPNPYHWLEDPDSVETKDFVGKQNMLTNSILEECSTREKFKERYLNTILN